MFCKNCGSNIDGHTFCPYCGTKTDVTQPSEENTNTNSQNVDLEASAKRIYTFGLYGVIILSLGLLVSIFVFLKVLLNLFLSPFIFVLFALLVLGTVFSIIANVKVKNFIKKNGECSETVRKAKILSNIGLVMIILSVIMFIGNWFYAIDQLGKSLSVFFG